MEKETQFTSFPKYFPLKIFFLHYYMSKVPLNIAELILSEWITCFVCDIRWKTFIPLFLGKVDLSIFCPNSSFYLLASFCAFIILSETLDIAMCITLAKPLNNHESIRDWRKYLCFSMYFLNLFYIPKTICASQLKKLKKYRLSQTCPTISIAIPLPDVGANPTKTSKITRKLQLTHCR